MAIEIELHDLRQLLDPDWDWVPWTTYARSALELVPDMPVAGPEPVIDPRALLTVDPQALWALRRALAYIQSGSVPPLAPGESPNMDEQLAEEMSIFRYHLVSLCDFGGSLYVPADFESPMFGSDTAPLPGGMLGSCPALLRELLQVAPLLHIELQEGRPTEPALDGIAGQTAADPLWRERSTWLSIWAAADAAVRSARAIIMF